MRGFGLTQPATMRPTVLALALALVLALTTCDERVWLYTTLVAILAQAILAQVAQVDYWAMVAM